MCVAFHPMHPAMVAGGTFNGDIHMWNTSAEGDPLLASSRLSELGHKEPVAKVYMYHTYIDAVNRRSINVCQLPHMHMPWLYNYTGEIAKIISKVIFIVPFFECKPLE